MRNVLGTVIVVFSALVAGPIFAADLVPVLATVDLVLVPPPLRGPGLPTPMVPPLIVLGGIMGAAIWLAGRRGTSLGAIGRRSIYQQEKPPAFGTGGFPQLEPGNDRMADTVGPADIELSKRSEDSQDELPMSADRVYDGISTRPEPRTSFRHLIQYIQQVPDAAG